VVVTISGASDKLAAVVQATGSGTGSEEMSELLPVHHIIGEKEPVDVGWGLRRCSREHTIPEGWQDGWVRLGEGKEDGR
jgi:hypothetical protein